MIGSDILKIIHTSDWHLGKLLEGNSRLEEQEQFIDEFVQKVEEKDADLIIIAGDIYDSGNPSAKAECLFYNGVKRISNNGRRAILIIAGNHDLLQENRELSFWELQKVLLKQESLEALMWWIQEKDI